MASQWRPLRDTLRTLRSGSPLPPLLRPPSLRARSLSSFHSSSRFRIPSIPSDVGPSPSSYTSSSSSFSSSPPPVSSCTYICSSFSSPLSLAHSLPSPRSHLAIPTPARPFSLPPPPCIPLSPRSPLLLLAPSLFLFRPGHANFLRDKSLAIKIGSWAIRVYAILLPSPAPIVSTTMSQDPRRAPRFLADDGEPTSYLGPDSWKIYRILIFDIYLIFSRYLVKSYSIRNMNYIAFRQISYVIYFQESKSWTQILRKIFTML